MTEMEISLRPGTRDDVEWIAELRAEVLRADLVHLGRYDEVRVRERLRRGFLPEHTRVIVVDGVDAGSITTRIEDGDRWIEHLYLAPHLQGRGVGSRVLQTVLSEPHTGDTRLLVLRGSAARRLYERHGFVRDHEDDVDVAMVRRGASERVTAAYARRAAEYAEHLGSMSSVHPSDQALVTAWASTVDGPLLDAGCGPGHWTAYLAAIGHEARGVDRVPEFVEHARREHPGVPFAVADVDALPDEPETLGGVLAWYSLIHHDPAALRRPLEEFARVVRPGGGLLVGFFTGPDVEPFDHAVATAHRWPVERLATAVSEAGFDVVETSVRAADTATPRPHGAIVARRHDRADALTTPARRRGPR
jgi:SAM-dependent methyltransferase